MELSEIIAELTKQPHEAVLAALPKGAGTLYQVIFDKGHSTASGKAAQEEQRLKGLIETAERERDEALERARTAGNGSADVKALREEHDRVIADLKDQHRKALKAKDDEVTAERLATAKEEVKSGLLAAGLDPDYADIQAEKHAGRLRFARDGKLEVMQQGKDVPFAASTRKEALQMLVEEVKGATPAKFLVSTATDGAGTGETENGTGGGTGRGTGNDKSFYDGIRKAAEKKQETTQRRSLDEAFPRSREVVK